MSALHADVLRVIWFEALPLRRDLHRMLRVRHCDTTLSSADVQFGAASPGVRHGAFFVGGTCPCRDYVVDLVVEAQRFLTAHARHLHNAVGAVRVHLRTRGAANWIRGGRVARGALARPERLRHGAIAHRLADGPDRALLEFVADEAGSPAPLDGPQHLLDRLADRVAREFGGTGPDHRVTVVEALPRVEAACRAARRSVVDGVPVTWWERYVEAPLGRRPRSSDEPLDVSAPGGAPAAEVPCPAASAAADAVVDSVTHGPGGVDAVVIAAVLAAGGSGEAEPSPAAVVHAVRRLAAREVIPEQVAVRFAADPARAREAAVLATELGAGTRPTGRVSTRSRAALPTSGRGASAGP